MANIEIGGRLHSTATGNVVTGANEVLDDTKNKKQSVINAEVDEIIGDDNTAGTIKGRIKTAEGKLDTLNGDSSTSGSVAKAVADAKSEVIGDAASDYNTLGKLEDKIQAEASARQDAITAETNRATTRENQIYDLVHTPEQHYVTVATYADLANIASPSDDTIYRVSSYNGKTSQVDNTVYSEYGYDGTNFVFLCVKSQIDEVYDISAHHSNNTYVDLAAALDGGNNIPQELRRGGMSVKFVQSSDNKYVQYRLMSDSFNTTPANWQGVDDEPTAGSDNLIKSGGIEEEIEKIYGNFIFTDNPSLPYYDVTGQAKYNTNRQKTFAIPVVEGDKFVISLVNYENCYRVAALDDQKSLLAEKSVIINGRWTDYEYVVPSGVSYIILCSEGYASAYKVEGTYESVMKVNDVDKAPAYNSQKFVESGGVFNSIKELRIHTTGYNVKADDFVTGTYWNADGTTTTNSYRLITGFIPVNENDAFRYNLCIDTTKFMVAAFDSNKNLLSSKSLVGTNSYAKGLYVVDEGVAFVQFQIYAVGGEDSYIDFLFNTRIYQSKGINIYFNDLISGGRVYNMDGTYVDGNPYRSISGILKVNVGDKFYYAGCQHSGGPIIAAFDDKLNFLTSKSIEGNDTHWQAGFYVIPDGVAYIQYQTTNIEYHEGDYCIKEVSSVDIKVCDLQKNVKSSNGTKIDGFVDFSSNADWTISNDGKKASTTAIGYQKGLMYRANCYSPSLNRWYVSQMNEDKWNISAVVKPSGTTFEVALGKWYPLSNIVVSIKYDGTNSKVCVYVCGTDLVPVLKKELPLTNVSLESGKSYGIRVEKRLDITCVFNIYVTDEYGNVDIFEGLKNQNGTPISWGWGTPCTYLISGDSLEVSNFSFGQPIEGELKVIGLGHSWMEASTMTPNGSGSTVDYDIANGYMYRVINAVGQKHGLNIARGGENAGNLVEKIKDVISWFGNAQYCIINIGGNDYAGGFAPEVTAQLIERCEYVKNMLTDTGIMPVWIVDDGWYVNTAEQYAAYNAWLLSQPYHVDVRGCFYENGVKQQNAYLGDGMHPTPETHEKIFNCIKAQAGYLFNI